MRINDILNEGGWASAATQNTTINPQTINDLMPILKAFEDEFNQELAQQSIPPIKIGRPVGSGTYYQQDLKNDPEKEYGDIDVQFLIPKIDSMSPNENRKLYFNVVQEFCRLRGGYETNNGVNVIFHNTPVGPIQIDLVAIFNDRVEWTRALAPEHGTKGVLSGSLYSALAQALNISISDDGIQGKTIDDKLVSFRKSKGTTLNQISTDHKNWAIDIAKFYGAKQATDSLLRYPGMKDEVKISDIINSFRGIAETLELNRLLPEQYESAEALMNNVKEFYLKKIDGVINSTKFNKAETPDAQEKAKKTKAMLSKRSQEIVSLF